MHKLPPLIDTEILRTFVAVVDTGSMTSAAKTIFRTPAAVSMQIGKLESIIDKPLLIRSNRNITLTQHGETVLSYARKMINLNQSLLNEFVAASLTGTVTVGLPEQFGTKELPIILSQFSKSFPHVSVNVQLTKSARILELVNAGDLDIGLISFNNELQEPNSSKLIRVDKLTWVTLKDSSLASQRPLPLSLAEHGCSWRTLAIEALDNSNIKYRIAYSSDNYIAQAAAVSSDLAIAALPESLISNDLVAVPKEFNLPKLGAVKTSLIKGAHINEAASALSSFIQHVLAD